MILFDDSEWKYTFIIVMSIIFIGCGIYTFIKYYLNKKKEEKYNEQINPNTQNQDVIVEETVLVKKEEPENEPNVMEVQENNNSNNNNINNNEVSETFEEFEPILKKKNKELE